MSPATSIQERHLLTPDIDEVDIVESKEDAILHVAEALVREGGYSGFSFRDIAKLVGIKSSSVHYHFPSKEDLGAAVAKHYTDRFIATLGAPQQWRDQGRDPIDVYVSAFRNALINDKKMCLCGLLGAEFDSLPRSVSVETKKFFERNLAWLESAYLASESKEAAKKKAIHALSLMEGAMISSHVFNDVTLFDAAVECLLQS